MNYKYVSYPTSIEMSEEMQEFEDLAEGIPFSYGHRNTKKKNGRKGNAHKVYTKQEKIEVVKTAKDQQYKRASEQHGVPIGTVNRWLADYNKCGEAAFDPPPVSKLRLPSNWSPAMVIPDLHRYSNGIILTGGTTGIPDPEDYKYKVEGDAIKEVKEEDSQNKDTDQDNKDNMDNKENTSTSPTKKRAPPKKKAVPPLGEGCCKLPTGIEGYKKLNFISPQFRLYAVKQGNAHGAKKAADAVGINESTMRRWMRAYKACGEDSHIFHVHVKRYVGGDNQGHGVVAYDMQQKDEIMDKAAKGDLVEVAYTLGLCPDTIAKWRKKYRPETVPYLKRAPGWKKNKNKNKKKNKRTLQAEEERRNKEFEAAGEEVEGIYLCSDDDTQLPAKRSTSGEQGSSEQPSYL